MGREHARVDHDLTAARPQLRHAAARAIRAPRPGRSGGGREGRDMSASETFLDERAARGTSSPILGMVLFVASEAMFFAALFGAYFTIFAKTAVWPPADIPIPDVPIPIALTVILVSSSFVLQAAGRAARRGHPNALSRRLLFTVGLGLAFLGLQGYDY